MKTPTIYYNQGAKYYPKRMNEYQVDEWSVDTRKWVIKTPRKLTHEEVFKIYNEYSSFDKEEIELPDEFEGITIAFIGTRYGDNSELEMNGDFKEEE